MKKILLSVFMLSVLVLGVGMVSATDWPSLHIDDVDLNGFNQVTVIPNEIIDTDIITTVSNTNWRSTGYLVEGQGFVCEDTTNHNSGTFTESFDITAPSSVGSYNVNFWVYQNSGCSWFAGDYEILWDGIIVVEPICGDGSVNQPSEECDDENNVNGDGCSASCIIEYCGDNIIQAGLGEVCDDSNTADGDGCSASCQVETGWECEDEPSVCTDIAKPVITNVVSDEIYPTCEDLDVEVCAVVTDNVGIQEIITTCHIQGQTTPSVSQLMFLDTTKGENVYCSQPDFSTSTFGAVDGKDITCTVSATDTSSNSNTEEITVDPLWTFDCLPPTAVITSEDGFTCNEGTTITLSGASSYDSNDVTPANELTYSWTGDILRIDGSIAEIDCVDDGPISVTLTVTDNAGHVSDATTEIVTVLNVIPVAIITGASTGNEGSDVTLTGSETDVGIEDTHTFMWTVDSVETAGETLTVHCVDEELILITLEATDDDLGVGTTIHEVQCLNVAPVVDAGADQTVNEGDLITIDPTSSDVGILDILRTYVNWDGSFVENDFTHTYCHDGEYIVTVRVDDDYVESSTDSLTITVNNVAPEITSTGVPYVGVVGEMITFSATATDAGCDELTYQWNFGEGYSYLNMHSWDSKFDGTVGLEVCDDDVCVYTDVPVTVYDWGIQLTEGWNLISIPVISEDTSIDSVFAGIIDSISYEDDSTAAILQYNAVEDKWYKSRTNSDKTMFEWNSASEITNIIPGYGYWIKMDEAAILYGNEADSLVGSSHVNRIELATEEWNLVGRYGINPVNKTVNHAFRTVRKPFYSWNYVSSTLGVFELVDVTSNGVTTWANTNTISTGKGYWVRTSAGNEGRTTVSYESRLS